MDVSFGVEDIGPPEGQPEGLEPAGILVHQESQVGRRLMRRRDSEQHYLSGETYTPAWFNSRRAFVLKSSSPRLTGWTLVNPPSC